MENQANESFDFETICRICLKIKEDYISIFQKSPMEKLKTYSEMLEECASVHVSNNKNLQNFGFGTHLNNDQKILIKFSELLLD